MALCTLTSVLLTGCAKQQKAEQGAETVNVKVMTVGASASQDDFNYSGTVEEENGTPLAFTVGGTLTQLRVKVGDRVQKGQLIASIDPTTIRNSYDMAHATRLQAEDAHRRMKQLHDKGSLPEIKWVEAESQLSQAISAENIAAKSLKDCNLYAPQSGVVSSKNVEAGQVVSPGMPIVQLSNIHQLNVRVSVPESEVGKVHIGQRADMMVSALQDRIFAGRVVEKGVVADPLSRSYSIKIRIENASSDVLPGMVTKIALQKTDRQESIIIPAQIVQLGDDNSNFVWVSNNGKAERRAVVCGQYTARGVSILSGLQQGDRIIVEGQQKVCNGTPIAEK